MKKLMTILAALTVLTICSCDKPARKYATTAFEGAPPRDYNIKADSALPRLPAEAEPQTAEKVETFDRKLIKEGTISFQTDDIDKTKSFISQTVQQLNGYISHDTASGHSSRPEHKLIIRVPADKFDALLNNISESVKKLDSKNIEVRDVTEEFIDVEARIKTKKELQTRYTTLLDRANTIEEILRIAKINGELQTEIESAEGRMKYLMDRIAFSTLSVAYYQCIDSPASPFRFFDFDFSRRFVVAAKDGWDGFLWFVIALTHAWVFLVFMGIVLFIAWLRRKRKNVS